MLKRFGSAHFLRFMHKTLFIIFSVFYFNVYFNLIFFFLIFYLNQIHSEERHLKLTFLLLENIWWWFKIIENSCQNRKVRYKYFSAGEYTRCDRKITVIFKFRMFYSRHFYVMLAHICIFYITISDNISYFRCQFAFHI